MGGGGGVEETPAQRQLAQHASELMADYKQRWLPVQQNLAKTIVAQGESGSTLRKQVAGKVVADTEAKFAPAQGALEAKLASTGGAAPGSSKGNLAVAGMGLDKATSKAMGLTMGDQHVDDAYMQGLQAITALGRGEKAVATNSMAQQAGMSAQQARFDADQSLQERAGNAQLGMQVVGYGVQQGMKPAPASQGPNWQGDSYDYRGTGLPNSLRGQNNYGG